MTGSDTEDQSPGEHENCPEPQDSDVQVAEPESAAGPLGIPLVFDNPALLAPPVQRAAYSDRTAWLMACLSELAYFKFEGDEDALEALLLDITTMVVKKNKAAIRERVSEYVKSSMEPEKDRKRALQEALKAADFELDGAYNVAGTQAFLVHRNPVESKGGMRVLVFRGTEVDDFRDLWADLDAKLVRANGGDAGEKIHNGFQNAFERVRSEIEQDLKKNPDLPLYITGHSLGGALAIVATWFIASNSLGACYTFGGPRVGTVELGKRFKTPIYRVVNAADYVARVPSVAIPSIIWALNSFFKWAPIPLGAITSFLDQYSGYRHFGDQRYIPHIGNADPNKLDIEANPHFFVLLGPTWTRIVSTYGKGGAADHSIREYRKKLKQIAVNRNPTLGQ